MASNINPNNIDGTYPVAGQDNDSQGFRDNFTNIKTNFQYAESEIEDLQGKVLLKSALTGTDLDNDMEGAALLNPKLQGVRFTRANTSATTGNVTIDFSTGQYHYIGALTGNVNLAFTNIPSSTNYAEWTVEFTANTSNAALNTVTLPSAVTIGNSAIVNCNANNVISFDTAGTHILRFGTRDGGGNVSVTDLTQTAGRFVTVAELQEITAAAADFTAFKAAIANIA